MTQVKDQEEAHRILAEVVAKVDEAWLKGEEIDLSKKPEKPILRPLDLYNHLPKTNCGECGEQSCLAFALKVLNQERRLEECSILLEPRFWPNFEYLRFLLQSAGYEV